MSSIVSVFSVDVVLVCCQSVTKSCLTAAADDNV